MYWRREVIRFISIVVLTFALGLVVLGACYGAVDLRRTKRIAAATLCPFCETAFGTKAVDAARERVAEEARAIRANNPGNRIRMPTFDWELVCGQCGRTSCFCQASKVLRAESNHEPQDGPG